MDQKKTLLFLSGSHPREWVELCHSSLSLRLWLCPYQQTARSLTIEGTAYIPAMLLLYDPPTPCSHTVCYLCFIVSSLLSVCRMMLLPYQCCAMRVPCSRDTMQWGCPVSVEWGHPACYQCCTSPRLLRDLQNCHGHISSICDQYS